jgi:hypothetical protein
MRLASYVPGELIPLPLSGSIPELPHVAKVENRTTLKISRKSIFGLLCCCVAIQRRYEGPWSILDESIWSLTSPRVKHISSSKKFRSSPQEDFFNTITRIADIAQFRSYRGAMLPSRKPVQFHCSVTERAASSLHCRASC